MPTNYWLKFGNTPLGFNGSGAQFTHIEQPGSLTVSLVGTGTGFDNTKDFNVTVTFGSAISYTIDGTPISTPSATCVLTLHAGQSSVIGNIPFGTTYTITETVSDEGYELGSITNASGTMTDAGSLSSVVTNVYHAPGQLNISVLLGGTGYDPTKAFAFTVTFGRAISYSVNGTPVGSPTNTYSGSIANGGSVVLGNIPSGVSYSVVESPLSQQDINSGYSTGTVTNGSGTMTDAGSVVATANYAFTDITSTLTVSVDLMVGVTASTSFPYYDAQKLCSFTVTFSEAITYTVDGVAISTPSSTYNGSLTKGGSVVLGKLPVGISYSVTENNFAQADRYRGYGTYSVTGGSGTTTVGGTFAATATYSFSPYKVDVGMQGTSYRVSFYENDGTTSASLYHLAPSGSGYDQDTGAAFSAGSKLRVFANGDGLTKKITITRESGTGAIYLWNGNYVQASGSSITLTMDEWGRLYYRTTPLQYDIRIKTTGE